MEFHNFALSEEQNMILDTVRKFAQDTVAPAALDNDEHQKFVQASFDGLAELGILGLPITEAGGGAELGMVSFVVALEEVAKVCGSSARLLLAHTGLCGMALDRLESAKAQEALGRLAAGEAIAAWVGPEYGIRATADGDGYKLDGSAALVTAATEAGLLVVAATDAEGTPLLFLVDAGNAAAEAVHALGFRASAPGRIDFKGVAVPGEALVAQGDAAAAALQRADLAAWIGGAAVCVGLGLAASEAARRHAGERIAFGKPLARQQAVARKLAECRRNTQAARHMTYHAARLLDAGQDAAMDARMAKLSAVEASVLASDEAIQIHGGYGYTVEYHVERCYRDAKTLEVLDGNTDILRDQIAAV